MEQFTFGRTPAPTKAAPWKCPCNDRQVPVEKGPTKEFDQFNQPNPNAGRFFWQCAACNKFCGFTDGLPSNKKRPAENSPVGEPAAKMSVPASVYTASNDEVVLLRQEINLLTSKVLRLEGQLASLVNAQCE